MAAHSIPQLPQDILDKLHRRAVAQRKVAQSIRRLADFDDEIHEAIERFYANGGTDSAQPGGHSDGRNQR